MWKDIIARLNAPCEEERQKSIYLKKNSGRKLRENKRVHEGP